MTDPEGFARAGEVGLEPGLDVYVAGRFAVLGRVDADVVAAAAAFWNPETIRTHWESALRTSDPATVATWYADLCADYGRRHLTSGPDLERWCDLAERVVAAAPVRGVPTFAGWRAMPLPDDAAGRAYQLSHVLRELRFGLHVNATIAAGLDPLVALATTPGMEILIGAFGWSGPSTPSEADFALRRGVEATTNELSAASLAGVTEPEVEEMIELVEAIVAAAD